MMSATVPLGRFFQLGYVTREFDAGLRHFSNRFGITQFTILRNLSGNARHIALAYSGDVMIELIEPQDPHGGIYAHCIPQTEGPARLHHHGHFISTQDHWRDMQQGLRDQGMSVAAEGAFGDVLRFLYVDSRADLGHFVEYILLGSDGDRLFGDVPRNG